jgi:hypothetical protein
MFKQIGQRSNGTRKGEPSSRLCGTAPAGTRVASPRQLPTDDDHDGERCARSANIRLINRRDSRLDLCPICLSETGPPSEPEDLDGSLHIKRGFAIREHPVYVFPSEKPRLSVRESRSSV